MSPHAPDTADLGFQVGDHVCAFYNGGSSLDDIVVDYALRGLQAKDKCICFVDRASSVRARIPAELMTREDILQFFTEDEAYLPDGHFSKDALLGGLEALSEEAVSGGYDRLWVLGDVSWIVRSTVDINTWFAAESGVNELATRRPQFIMCLYDLGLFDGETVMYVLQTHTKIFVNGIIITNPHYIPRRQFLGSP
ncbi:MAG TPA: MEDS domain-containing protein [Streptosporangiaceae bacterium]